MPPVSAPVDAQAPPPWWRQPAVWILAGLFTFLAIAAVVVIVMVWPDGESGTRSTPTASPRTQGGSPTAATAAPSITISIPTDPPTSAATGPSELQTVDGLNALLDSIRNRFGDTMGFQLVVYPDYANIERVAPEDVRPMRMELPGRLKAAR